MRDRSLSAIFRECSGLDLKTDVSEQKSVDEAGQPLVSKVPEATRLRWSVMFDTPMPAGCDFNRRRRDSLRDRPDRLDAHPRVEQHGAVLSLNQPRADVARLSDEPDARNDLPVAVPAHFAPPTSAACGAVLTSCIRAT